MNNGSKTTNNDLRIITNNFTYDQIQFIGHILYKKYNINTSIHKGGKNKNVLYINSKDTFIKLIKPYMVKSIY